MWLPFKRTSPERFKAQNSIFHSIFDGASSPRAFLEFLFVAFSMRWRVRSAWINQRMPRITIYPLTKTEGVGTRDIWAFKHLSRDAKCWQNYIQTHGIQVGNFPLVHYDSWIRSCVCVCSWWRSRVKNWKRQFWQQQKKTEQKAQTKANERAKEEETKKWQIDCRVFGFFHVWIFYCGAYCRTCMCARRLLRLEMFNVHSRCVNIKNERKIRRVAMIHIFCRFVSFRCYSSNYIILLSSLNGVVGLDGPCSKPLSHTHTHLSSIATDAAGQWLSALGVCNSKQQQPQQSDADGIFMRSDGAGVWGVRAYDTKGKSSIN